MGGVLEDALLEEEVGRHPAPGRALQLAPVRAPQEGGLVRGVQLAERAPVRGPRLLVERFEAPPPRW